MANVSLVTSTPPCGPTPELSLDGIAEAPMALDHRSACQPKVNDARSSELTVLGVTGHVLANCNSSNEGHVRLMAACLCADSANSVATPHPEQGPLANTPAGRSHLFPLHGRWPLTCFKEFPHRCQSIWHRNGAPKR